MAESQQYNAGKGIYGMHIPAYSDPPDIPEIPLRGGNVAQVFRVGDTIRRSTGPWTPAVHALLRYLEEAGFGGAPRVLGIDGKGREVLTFLEGDVFEYPMPDFVWTEDALAAVAGLLREYHDLVRGFVPPPGATWQVQPGAPSAGPIICHNDIAPYNTVFSNQVPVGFIDWDLAAPGTNLYDIAHAVWYWIPLFDPPEIPAGDQPERLRLFCDAYGLTKAEREQLLPTVMQREAASYRALKEWGEAGKQGWAEMWRTGHATGKLNDQRWLEQRWQILERALSG